MQRAKQQPRHNGPRPQSLPVCADASKSLAWVFTLAIVLLSCCSGCSTLQGVRNYIAYNDTQNDFVIGWRNRVWSIQAWHMEREKYRDHPYLPEFGDGFRTGFRDVAAGGNGCPPVVPPRKFWSWRYQSPEGQAKVAAWFEGYPVGAMVAERNQAGEFSDIQVSYSIEAQYSPRFRAGELPGLPPPTYSPETLPQPQSTTPAPHDSPGPEGRRSNVEATDLPSVLPQPLETRLPANAPLGTGIAQPESTNSTASPSGVGLLNPLPINPTETLPTFPDRRSADNLLQLADPSTNQSGLGTNSNRNATTLGQPTTVNPRSTILGTPVPNPAGQTTPQMDTSSPDSPTLNSPTTNSSTLSSPPKASVSKTVPAQNRRLDQPWYSGQSPSRTYVTANPTDVTMPNQLTYSWPDDPSSNQLQP